MVVEVDIINTVITMNDIVVSSCSADFIYSYVKLPDIFDSSEIINTKKEDILYRNKTGEVVKDDPYAEW